MLWFFGKQDINTAVAEATPYFQKKYGVVPTIVYVNAQVDALTTGLEVIKVNYVLPFHLVIGVEDETRKN